MNQIHAEDALELHGPVITDKSVRITWMINCHASEVPDSVFLRYNGSASLANEGEVWKYTKPVPFTQGHIDISNLSSLTSYVYQVGYQNDDGEYVWTKRSNFKTGIPWGITRFLLMVGALCLFIYGMKTMSEGIQASAGVRLRRALERMTKNRFKGVLSGFFLTGLLQSSSATTVMTVSFVNAGLITLTESAGIMMGANIGTTITGWLVSLLGFRVDISVYALIIFAFAIPLLLLKRYQSRSWSNAMIGFALLFMGLGFLKQTVPTLTQDSALVQSFLSYSNIPVLGTLMFVALGMIVTIIVQSSSTAFALTMTLCVSGVIPFEVAAAMVLGENIGTTATAEVAALVGNVHAKRSARIHTLFNVIGVAWMIFAMPFVLKAIGEFLPADPFANTDVGRQAATTGLAAFHTVFNTVNLLILIWFTPLLVKLASKTVRSKGVEDEEFRLEFIDTSIEISEISIIEAKRELSKFAELTKRMSGFVRSLLIQTDQKDQSPILKRIKKYEKITDRMEVEIAEYCRELSRRELSAAASENIRAILAISGELERVGDVFYQMSMVLEKKTTARIWFTPEQRDNIIEMFDLVDKAHAVMMANLSKEETEQVNMEKAEELEQKIDAFKETLRKDYMKKVERGSYNMRSGAIYSDLFSSLEKIGDHIHNVSEALSGEI